MAKQPKDYLSTSQPPTGHHCLLPSTTPSVAPEFIIRVALLGRSQRPVGQHGWRTAWPTMPLPTRDARFWPLPAHVNFPDVLQVTAWTMRAQVQVLARRLRLAELSPTQPNNRPCVSNISSVTTPQQDVAPETQHTAIHDHEDGHRHPA